VFLNFLLELSEQRKNIPLSVDQRLNLIKSLLHEEVKTFNFELMGCPSLIDRESLHLLTKWQIVYDDLWTELAAKCPNLRHVKEKRPKVYGYREPLNIVKLNSQALKLSKLICLETDTVIDSGINR